MVSNHIIIRNFMVKIERIAITRESTGKMKKD